MWREMMQPRTALRYRSPFLMPYPRQPCTPAYGGERGGVSAAGYGRRGRHRGRPGGVCRETRASRGSVRKCVCALPCPAGSRLSAACSTLAVPNPGPAAPAQRWGCVPAAASTLTAGRGWRPAPAVAVCLGFREETQLRAGPLSFVSAARPPETRNDELCPLCSSTAAALPLALPC